MTQRQQVFAAIDAANAADPRLEDGQPVELLYGQRMTAEQERLYPDAPDALAIACRGQHIERWLLPRKDFPEGREGYLTWRREQPPQPAALLPALDEEGGETALPRDDERRGEGEGAGADRGDATRPGGPAGQPGDQAGIVEMGMNPSPAGDDQRHAGRHRRKVVLRERDHHRLAPAAGEQRTGRARRPDPASRTRS